MEYKKLVMVTTGANHNKYYEMIPNADGSTFTVKYGRVGANPQVRSYDSYDFNKKYREKLNKGYVAAMILLFVSLSLFIFAFILQKIAIRRSQKVE